MPDNNFEDDVRKKMEELRFVPSGDVWTKVEENIREGRKRRRILFWLPLTGLLVGGLIWFAWPAKNGSGQARLRKETAITRGVANQGNAQASASTTKKHVPYASDSTASPSASSAVSGETSGTVSDKISGETSDAISGEKANPETTGNTETGNSSVTGTSEKSKKNNSDDKKPVTAKHNRNSTASPVIISEADYLASVSRETEKAKKQATRSDIVSGGKKETVLGPDQTAPAIQAQNESENLIKKARDPLPGKDSLASTIAKSDLPKPLKDADKSKQNPAVPKNAATTKTLAKKDKNKIEWGFTASGGVTKQIEKNAIPSDVLNRAYANSSVYIIQRSNLKPGPAFSAGLVAAKQIGKTWRLQTGIQYQYASSRLPNSSNLVYPIYNSYNALTGVGFAAAPGSSGNRSYTNRYQFIQIPVVAEKQFGVNSPLSAQAGLAFGYLTSVHALIYQPLLDQYSVDNSKFNKFQVSASFGVYWKFKVDPHWSLRAGPEMQYQPGNFMKSTVSVNDHLLTGAIKVILLHSAK